MDNQVVLTADQEINRASKSTCMACVFVAFRLTAYLSAGLILLFVLAFTKASPALFIMALVISVAGFIWQSIAARRGCIMPLVVFSLFLGFETIVVSTAFYQADPKSQNMVELRIFLDRYSPGLYKGVSRAFSSVAEKSDRLVSSGLNALKNITVSNSDKNIAILERQFADNPGDAATVLALADAYMARGDIASVQLATSLYEALVEVCPSDSFMARLADAYCVINRSDKAFAAALQRSWLPHANSAGIARQIALIAVKCQQLHRGIFELERLLNHEPVESEEIIILLAALYIDAGNSQRAEKLLDFLATTVPAETKVYQEAVLLRKALVN